MPRERKEFFRESNIREKERIIVLAFEGNIAEEAYFQEIKASTRFLNDLVYLHILTRPRSDTNSAPQHVFQRLQREAKDHFHFGDKDELWMVIDRDKWSNIPEMVELCEAEGNMYVAVSNPCFEFWLLLHIFEFSEISERDRAKILQNRRISNKKTFIDQFLGERIEGGYNKRRPMAHRFLPGLDQAVEAARALDTRSQITPTGLGSHVYKIVEGLIGPES
ncbi:RloB family protein [Pontibacter sp. G13]|uniref:RloB family protein n=1 Tax=Pontibacter sp. G13 TaxID=3074898 RepID=UPI00288A0151|nr:RloB family protein [Pontibacter sp. G13]WNJ20560.1 RloB family protein [Pontibacter sp. G13]